MPTPGSTSSGTEVPTKNLPKLIFGEIHSDPATKNIFMKLLPRLQRLGYTGYFSENFKSLEEEVAAIDDYSSYCKEMEGYFTEKKLDIYNPWDQKVFFNSFEPGKFEDIENQVAFLPGNKSRKEFLLSLSKYNMSYKPIDLELSTVEVAYNQFPARDAKMSKAYVDEAKPVFGEVGIHHLPGVQNKIIDSIGVEAASRDFIFFNISSDQSLNDSYDENCREELSEIPDTAVQELLSTHPKDVMKSLPLGIKCFNPDTMDEDEICDQIIKNIEKHVKTCSGKKASEISGCQDSFLNKKSALQEMRSVSQTQTQNETSAVEFKK